MSTQNRGTAFPAGKQFHIDYFYISDLQKRISKIFRNAHENFSNSQASNFSLIKKKLIQINLVICLFWLFRISFMLICERSARISPAQKVLVQRSHSGLKVLFSFSYFI